MFRSLGVFNYRLWFVGALISNTGAWAQRTAQDWIVLTELTDLDATALGITMALQFGPLLLLMPLAGLMADRFNRRILLMWTQGAQGLLALGLGVLVIAGHAELWQVYVFALLLGVVTAIDAPVRQAFVGELVTNDDLSNAVALNSTSFQSARLIGPAMAGILIGLIGSGPVFLINAASFIVVLVVFALIRTDQLVPSPRLGRARGQIRDGLRYVRSRSDILVVLFMVFVIGTFGFNFPIFVATMSTVEFGLGAAEFGLLSSMMAIGAIVASLVAARRTRVRFVVIVAASVGFGVVCIVAGFSPTYWFFAGTLVLLGACAILMVNTANAYVQTTTDPALRGRVMALFLAVFAGGTPIGSPIVGLVANTLGPRWALGVGAGAGLLAAAVAGFWMLRRRNRVVAETPVEFDPADREPATQEIAIVQSATERKV